MQRRAVVVARPKRPRGRKLNPKQKKEVKTLITRRLELKYFAAGTSVSITTTAVINGVPFDISQGVTDNQRIGDSLQWAGTLELNYQVVNSITDNYNISRIMVVQWHPVSSLTTPTVADFLLPGPSGVSDNYSVYKHDTRQDYKILYDRVHKTVGPASGASTPLTSAMTTGMIRARISLAKVQKHVQYQAAGLQASNRLFLIYMSDSAAVSHPSLEFATKVFYRDG